MRVFRRSLALMLLAAPGLACAQASENLDKIQLPAGFQISIYAEVPNARAMTLSPNGTLFVGSYNADKVHAVLDTNQDYKADMVIEIMGPGNLPDGTKFNMPAGVAFRDGALYVSSISHIVRLDDIENRLNNPPTPVIVSKAFSDKTHHGWKFIAFGPDGKLYVPQGAWCNVCDFPDELFASIARMNPDGSGLEVVAKGVRNSVGFDWHPQTGELWFTENGRDMMGDDMPGDELNRVSAVGQHFGYPYVHQGDTLDPQHGKGKNVGDYVAPAQVLGPHVAALGMRFYTGAMFPAEYQNQIFIAEHGSWNRRDKIGYRVMLVKHDGKNGTSYEPFATGWLQDGEEVLGRPADVLVMPDGSLLISDDQADVIYRVTYKG